MNRKEKLGWEPETKFEEGIKRIMDWYFENKECVGKVTILVVSVLNDLFLLAL